MKTGPVGDAKQAKQCVHNILCQCGRCYIGETSRPSEIRIKEYKYNWTQSLLKKSKLAQHAYEEGHQIHWKDVNVLQIEPNTTYRKYKESTHMPLAAHPISQPSLNISPHLDSPSLIRSQRITMPACLEYMVHCIFLILVLHRCPCLSLGFIFFWVQFDI
jgi:hypothetical protein